MLAAKSNNLGKPDLAGSVREPVRWSRRRWVFTFLAILLLQTGLIFLLVERPRPVKVPDGFHTGIYPANTPLAVQQVAGMRLWQDPTLFVLPQPHTFSERAWLAYTPVQHQFSDWTEPPRWLEFNEQHLGESFAWYARTVTNPPRLIADLPLPPLTAADLPVPNQPIAGRSQVNVDGALAARPLRTPIPLCAWTQSEILSNTVIQLVVDAEGYPRETTLLAESGLRAADVYALQQAANARFEPLRRPEGMPSPDGRLTWGTLVFQWQTIPPAATNASAVLP